MASTISRVKSFGCEVVKRTRRIPSTSATASSSSTKFHLARRRIAVGIHGLAEQLNFRVARIGQAARFRENRLRWRGCAPARACAAPRNTSRHSRSLR